MRPIDADELLSLYEGEDENLRVSLRVVKENIKDMPTIEAEPVKRGHWIHKHDDIYDYYECSVCGRWVDPIPNPYMVLKAFPYCHCGTRMVKVELEGGEEIGMDGGEE